MAAVLACRRRGGAPRGSMSVLDFWGAALSHRSAAVHWGLLRERQGPVDVTAPGHGGKKRREGIRVHRSQTLRPADVTLRDGIPVTTPARTIADLRRVSTGKNRLVAPRELRRAIRQADVLGLPIGVLPERDGTRSDLEGDFLALCRRHRVPEPEVNVRVGRHLVDFLWRERRLIVETDGYIYHRGETAFEDDRSRDFELRRLGYRVERLSAGQLRSEAPRIAHWLAGELSRAAP
jgi:very-short-patch-repair endonuclease